jgi:hypothetical protein
MNVGTDAGASQQSRINVDLSSPSPWNKLLNNQQAQVGLSVKC